MLRYTNQSQCKNAKDYHQLFLILHSVGIVFLMIFFLVNSRIDIYNNLKIVEFTNKVNKYFCPYGILNNIYQNGEHYNKLMEWIPYSQFTNVKEIARGGLGII